MTADGCKRWGWGLVGGNGDDCGGGGGPCLGEPRGDRFPKPVFVVFVVVVRGDLWCEQRVAVGVWVGHKLPEASAELRQVPFGALCWDEEGTCGVEVASHVGRTVVHWDAACEEGVEYLLGDVAGVEGVFGAEHETVVAHEID